MLVTTYWQYYVWNTFGIWNYADLKDSSIILKMEAARFSAATASYPIRIFISAAVGTSNLRTLYQLMTGCVSNIACQLQWSVSCGHHTDRYWQLLHGPHVVILHYKHISLWISSQDQLPCIILFSGTQVRCTVLHCVARMVDVCVYLFVITDWTKLKVRTYGWTAVDYVKISLVKLGQLVRKLKWYGLGGHISLSHIHTHTHPPTHIHPHPHTHYIYIYIYTHTHTHTSLWSHNCTFNFPC
jgi:hypothetical protein